jgi:hypothetical protein
MTTGAHSAAASAAGYQYQTRWALLNLLREASHRPELILTLEMHDDVAWEDASGEATELLQTKLHAKSDVGLGDKDTDVRKTLLIWLKRPDARDPHGPDLALVTTSVAAEDSAAYALRPDSGCPDVPAAMRLLTAAALESSAVGTTAGRERFLALSEAERWRSCIGPSSRWSTAARGPRGCRPVRSDVRPAGRQEATTAVPSHRLHVASVPHPPTCAQHVPGYRPRGGVRRRPGSG